MKKIYSVFFSSRSVAACFCTHWFDNSWQVVRTTTLKTTWTVFLHFPAEQVKESWKILPAAYNSFAKEVREPKRA